MPPVRDPAARARKLPCLIRSPVRARHVAADAAIADSAIATAPLASRINGSSIRGTLEIVDHRYAGNRRMGALDSLPTLKVSSAGVGSSAEKQTFVRTFSSVSLWTRRPVELAGSPSAVRRRQVPGAGRDVSWRP